MCLIPTQFVGSAAFYCVGELMAALGSQVMSFMAEIVTTSIKNFRTSSSVR